MADPLELSQDEIFQYLFSQPGLGTPHDFALPEPSADFDFDLGSERIAELAEAQTAPGYTSFAENFFGQTEFPFPLDIPDNTSSPISSPNTSGVPSRGLSPDSGPDPDPGYDDFLSLLFADEIQQNLGADMMQYLNLDGSSSQATSEPSAQPSESGLPIEAKSAAESSSSQALADISNRDPTASDKAFGDIAEALLASLTTADAPTQ